MLNRWKSAIRADTGKRVLHLLIRGSAAVSAVEESKGCSYNKELV
jgi:hypothetical protein